MIRKAILFFLLVLSGYATGQWIPAVLDLDTVRYAHRTGGELDTVDRISGRYSSTLPGGGVEMPFGFPTIDFYSKYRGMYRFHQVSGDQGFRYSGLPHLGFSYVFGTQGTQKAMLNYQQVFGKKVLVNFDLGNDRSTNFLRFGNHVLNELGLDVLKKGSVWSFKLNIEDKKQESTLNGGLYTGADPNEFPLIFLSVNKRDAASTFRSTGVRLDNYFDFKQDSSRSVGLMTSHGLKVDRRSYRELDTLFGIYSMINFDSLQTNDRYQLSETDHAVGFFHGSQRHFLSVRVHEKYWKYYHPGTDTDTLETAIMSDLSIKWNKLSIDGKAYVNLIGAGNEWRSEVALKAKAGRVNYHASIATERLWPVQFQRNYLANNFAYNLNEYDLQGRTVVNAGLSRNLGNWLISGRLSSLYLQDNYFFDHSAGTWSSTLYPELWLNCFAVKAHWKRKGFSLLSSYMYTMESQNLDLTPDHVASLRGQVKGTLFRSKKLLAYIGGELLAYSGANALTFVPVMDTYILASSPVAYNGLFNAHVFGGFQIDEFRLFVRYENLGNLWNDKASFTVVGHPVPSGQLRIGITWDFFN